jgi:hypothetical protein
MDDRAASKTSAEAPSEPAPSAADTTGADQTPAAAQQPKEKRARIYSGFCRLVVDEIEQAKQELESLAVGSGGYVEAVNGPVVTLRVPAGRFAEVFAAVQKLGEVANKVIETYDVSDTLRDQETRLRLAERARERLYQLLERSSDVKERLAILREIKRLTEEMGLTLEDARAKHPEGEIDPERMALFGCSANTLTAQSLMQESGAGIKCAVFYYPILATPDGKNNYIIAASAKRY